MRDASQEAHSAPSALLHEPLRVTNTRASDMALPAQRWMRGQLWGFSLALFTSALLLFWVQPMVAKLLLPALGGTPTVWNTCMLFFQAVLLAGYAYSHFLTRHFPIRVQGVIHLVLLLLAFAALPIGLSDSMMSSAPWQSNPFFWLVTRLFLIVGLPFFVVSTSGPLFQNWFSRTDHPAAKDPYFLYAASNLGSLLALLGYPLFIEPRLRLSQQTQLWTALYCGLLVAFVLCLVMVWNTRSTSTANAASTPEKSAAAPAATDRLTLRRRLFWILLAFVPSSLMLGVTTYMTTDIASVPLLWVIPLSLYLLTFILAFAKKQVLPLAAMCKVLPGIAVALIFLVLAGVVQPPWLVIGLHLLFFFVAAMVAHGRLAADRPGTRHLTEFYLYLSIGGVLGGLFNALLSPMAFRTVVEYPLVMVLACALRTVPGQTVTPKDRWLDWLLPAVTGVVTALMAVLLPHWRMEPYQLCMAIIFGIPLLACYFFSRHPVRFALGLGAVLLGGNFYTAISGQTLHKERNFFGALKVAVDPEGAFRRFYHGTTVHGIQFIDPAHQGEPLSYYHRTGPFGDVFATYQAHPATPRVAVLGMGAGAMACYASPGQDWTFYEIDPAVLSIAQNTNYFTYLSHAANSGFTYKIGDARLRIREAAPESYGLIICDAFSSDCPPVHLITREALALYLTKLAPNGLICFNISSRWLDFTPVLGNLAQELHLSALHWNDEIDAAAAKEGKYSSHWVVLSRQPAALDKFQHSGVWRRLEPAPGFKVWTDDYSNLLSIFCWN